MNLLLRRWKLSDVESLSINANNASININMRDDFPYPYTLLDAKNFILEDMKQTKSSRFAIDIDGNAVGGIELFLRTGEERIIGEISFWLGERFWNKGIMSKALSKAIDYFFEKFSIFKIYAIVFDYNIISQHILKKKYFVKEAILKQSAIKNDIIIDQYYYSLPREKWLSENYQSCLVII